MSKPRWTWAVAASATLAGVAAAVLMTGTSPARSEDGEEKHVPPSDFAAATTALDHWDDDDARERAIAEYVGEESRDAAFSPLDDATYIDTH